ncbi:MAG TPA: hypothetical protein PK280_05865 [Planctomycetota bacterium]|nr:hypothetical protein [Planctomycetota bacterium]
MRAVTTVLALLIAGSIALAGEPPKPAGETAVLDLNSGSFRVFLGWKTPVLISADGKLKPLLEPKGSTPKDEDRKPMPVLESDRPAATWNAAEFDDSGWPRGRDGAAAIHVGIDNPGRRALEGNLVCLRGRFRVIDPGQVRGLKLFLRYVGGAVVYVNGTELARGHLPEGKLGPDTLAARYADEAYVDKDGKVLARMSEDAKVAAELLKVRGRELKPGAFADGVEIPAAMLRKGVNVVAVEVRAAPAHEACVEGSAAWKGVDLREYRHCWPHAAVTDARVTCASAAGLVPSVWSSPGIEAAVVPPTETDFAWDFAHPGENVFPIRLVGARNGSFSGRVVLSSSGAIKGFKATASELVEATGKGKIPAAAVQLRLAEHARAELSWAGWDRFDRLLVELPAEIPPVPVDPRRPEVAMAVAPVWVTVKVPPDAPAGEYAGTVSLEAAGAAGPVKIVVPVKLKVNGWRLPDPKDFSVHNNIYSSEDTLAKFYKVPMWSDKHFELIGKSMAAFQQVGNKLCTLHLAIKSPGINNTESIVRWVKKADGAYDYDFSLVEKYLDVYEKNCGKPGILAVGDLDKTRGGKAMAASGWPRLAVTVLDPATGKLEALPQPAYGTPESEAFWKPVLTELRKRLEKRGWFDVTAVSHDDYASPPIPEFVSTIKAIWPDGRWLQCGHPYMTTYQAADKSTMPVACVEYVWGAGQAYDPDYRGSPVYNPQKNGYPKPWAAAPPIALANPRYGASCVMDALRTSSPQGQYRFISEAALQGGCRGLGRVGGDSWPLPKGQGAWRGYEGRYDWDSMFDSEVGGTGPGENVIALFSPGPDGAAFNARMEMFREGVQVCEAIIFLQRAVVEKKVGADVAKRIDDLLVERARFRLHCGDYATRRGVRSLVTDCSDWQLRDDKLFALCAEVAGTAGK